MGHGLWLHDLSQGGRFSQAPGGCTERAVILSFCSDWFSRVPKKSSKRTRPKKHDLTLFCPFKNQTSPAVHVKFEVWYTRSAGTANGNALSHAPRNLMQQPPKGGNSDVLHVQYWMVGTFKIKDSGGETLMMAQWLGVQHQPQVVPRANLKELWLLSPRYGGLAEYS